MRVLAEHAAVFPDLNPAPLPDRGLETRDAALMHAMYDATVRRWTTLEWLLCVAASRDVRELEPAVRAGLLCGAAQLILLDRIPDHAAIDESVEWVKGERGQGAGGVVNAILRKLIALRGAGEEGRRDIRPAWTRRRDEIPLGDGRALGLAADALPEDPILRTAVATGISTWLLGRWWKRHGETEAVRIALHSTGPAPVILNATQARTPVEFPLAQGGSLVLTRHEVEGHFCVDGPREALVGLLLERRDIWVQDPSSTAAVESVRDLRPSLIVDVCAGQGTKTRQMALAFGSAKIIASDTDARRFQTLKEEFRGSEQVEVVPPRELERAAGSKADLVLLDVPCSNTGVLARRVEARHRAGEAQIRRLAGIQREIFAKGEKLVSRSGAVLYATCSIENEENGLQVAAMTGYSAMPATRERWVTPRGGGGTPAAAYSDGSYSAVLTR